jgi:hypothetical protein
MKQFRDMLAEKDVITLCFLLSYDLGSVNCIEGTAMHKMQNERYKKVHA